jgi:hypothetical protein
LLREKPNAHTLPLIYPRNFENGFSTTNPLSSQSVLADSTTNLAISAIVAELVQVL